MRNIEVKVLNPGAIQDAEKMLVATARITQRAEKISCMDDLLRLIDKPYLDMTVDNMTRLPHPTLQKFGIVNIAVVGASRRFLGQITRHQNEVKFMSGSLQYSDYSGKAQFTVPYEVIKADNRSNSAAVCVADDWHEKQYLRSCEQAFAEYEKAIQYIGNDAAAYMMPQGLRNVLIISALPYQIKHMISQRVCNRNTLETQYVMLRIWEELYGESVMFEDTGAPCMHNGQWGLCPEGKMSCGRFPAYNNPTDFLDARYPLIRPKHKDLEE